MAKNKTRKKYNPNKINKVIENSVKNKMKRDQNTLQAGYQLGIEDLLSAMFWKLRLDGYSDRRLKKFTNELLVVYDDINEFRLSPRSIVKQIEIETGFNPQEYVNNNQAARRLYRIENHAQLEAIRNYDVDYKPNYEI